MKRNSSTRSLTATALHILVSLSGQPLHGYGIIKEVESLFGRENRIGPGSLYDNLPRLIDDGFIEEMHPGKEDSRKRYKLTVTGAEALSAELDRMAAVLREGRKRLKILKAMEE